MFRKNFREGAKSNSGGIKLTTKSNRTQGKRSRDMGNIDSDVHYRTHIFFSPSRAGNLNDCEGWSFISLFAFLFSNVYIRLHPQATTEHLIKKQKYSAFTLCCGAFGVAFAAAAFLSLSLAVFFHFASLGIITFKCFAAANVFNCFAFDRAHTRCLHLYFGRKSSRWRRRRRSFK